MEEDPEFLSQFRPIGLSNVSFKIASKVIANRLKPFLHDIISYSQSAFVPGRLITDNILVAFELNHHLKNRRTGKKGHMTLKLDMSKAYDRVEWPFLEKVMFRLGFESNFINLIMLCVRSVTYSVLVNGSDSHSFMPERGIRQGDPLSPYLFLFISEALSALIKEAEEFGLIKGIAVSRHAPIVSHLLFADDTLLFCEARREVAAEILSILQRYERATGQEINMAKSVVVFSKNTSAAVMTEVQDILGMPVEDKHAKYLGLPAVVGRTKKEIFSYLRDRAWSRVHGWKPRNLSGAGKEILIKAVIQSIPTFTMSCFKIPDSLVRELESIASQFWWGSSEHKKIHWLAWEKMCRSKKDGGLGFRNLRAFNLALLAKQAWRIFFFPDSLLGQIFKAKYFPNGSLFEAKLGNNLSFSWRGIHESIKVLERGMRWRVGDGTAIDVWTSNWIPRPTLFRPITPQPLDSAGIKVASLIDGETGWWNFEEVQRIFCEEDVKAILSIPLGRRENVDTLIWHYSRSGEFTVRSAHYLIETLGLHINGDRASSSSNGKLKWDRIWKMNCPNKIKIFTWRLCKNILPTTYNLMKRKLDVNTMCVVCGCGVEDLRHCFSTCHVARQCWALLATPCSLLWREREEIEEWVERIFSEASDEIVQLIFTGCWAIWGNRNRIIAGEGVHEPGRIVNFITASCQAWKSSRLVDNSRSGIDQSEEWMVPLESWIKINFDGAVFDDEGGCGLGVIARDWNDKCLAWSQRRIFGIFDPKVAEALAAQLSVQIALKIGWPRFNIEGDCLELILDILNPKPIDSEYDQIVRDIRGTVPEESTVNFQWVRREANGAAHALARHAIKDRDWMAMRTGVG